VNPNPLERILLVEDDPDIRTISLFALEAVDGVTVKACGSGAEALGEAPSFAPQLVLLDVMMPELDGPATLAGLRHLPGLERTPVVFMTAKVQPEEIVRYKALGAVDVIAKPFDATTLGEVVLSIWERLAAADAEAETGEA
jgi:CheY-like chemotaxis protein